MKDIVKELSSNKAACRDIPLKLLKECDFRFHHLANCVNEAIQNTKFTASLKLSRIVVIHKNLPIKHITGHDLYFQ